MQPGEIRTCAGCHGENSKNQAGLGKPLNKPEALRQLLRYWKQNNNVPTRVRINGSQPRVPGRAAAAQTVPTAAAQPVIANPANVAGARPADQRRTIPASPYDVR
jgi:hypothetical protein